MLVRVLSRPCAMPVIASRYGIHRHVRRHALAAGALAGALTVLSSTSARAQSSGDMNAPRIGYGLQIAIGGVRNHGGALDRDLEQAGFGARGSTQWSLGLDVDASRGRLVFGAGVHALGGGQDAQSGRTQELAGWTSGFTVGTIAWQSARWAIMPLAGGGSTRYTLRLRDPSAVGGGGTSDKWPSLLAAPGKETRVRLSTPGVDLGVRVRHYLTGHGRRDYAPITEVRAGYLLPAGNLEARARGRSLTGTDDIRLDGWYLRVGVGIGRPSAR